MSRKSLIDDQEFIERVREHADVCAGTGDPDDPLDFYGAARHLGASDAKADAIDTLLTERVMRARGAL